MRIYAQDMRRIGSGAVSNYIRSRRAAFGTLRFG